MLKLYNASKIYSVNGVCALRGVNFDVRSGEYVSITGASGSGKSTLMHILGLLDTLTEGSYILENEDVSSLSSKELSRLRGEKIGFVFQRFRLIKGMNALENTALPLALKGVPKNERIALAEEALASVGLSHRLMHKPGQLSGGQQQRVAVARAIVTSPSVVLADEPTAGLDPQAAGDVLELFDMLHEKGNTIILITHDKAAALRARRRLRLEDGILYE